jgi:MFS family permease
VVNFTARAARQSGPGEGIDILGRRWPVLLGCHLALAGAVSPVFAGIFSLFIGPMSTDLHWSRSQLALGMSVFIFASTLATPVAGHILDRFGARAASLISALVLPLAITFVAMSPPSYPTFLGACALVGVAGALTLPMTYVSILPQWFDKRLGLSMALVVSGLGTGGVASALLAGRALSEFGWQGAWLAIAAWSAFLTLTGRSLIPWRSVSRRAAAKQAEAVPGSQDLDSVKFSTDPRFWFITFAFTIGLLVTLAMQTNVASALTDRGLSVAFAASTIAMTGVASGIARLIGGALLDLFPVRVVGGVTFASQAIGCLLLALAPSPLAAMAGAAMVSFAYGVEADMIPYVIRRRYGVLRFGRIYGIMFGFVQLGAIVGPAAVALAFDTFGDYSGAFITLAGCSMVASVTILLAGAVPSAKTNAPTGHRTA